MTAPSTLPVQAPEPFATAGSVRRAEAVVGSSWTADRMPLGLGEPLRLMGGGVAALDRLRRDARDSWRGEMACIVEEALRCISQSGAPGLRLPPLVLGGDAGAGRTHLARRFAHAAGLPHVTLELTGARSIRCAARGPDLALPSLPVLAMALTRCANPVVTVPDADALDPAVQRELAWIVDGANAGRCCEDAVGGFVDFSHVTWMIQVRDEAALCPFLRRLLRPVHLFWSEDDMDVHLVEVLAEAAVDENLGDLAGSTVADALAAMTRVARMRSTAELYRTACTALAAVAR